MPSQDHDGPPQAELEVGVVKCGDMVALRVEPDEHDLLPFAVGKVTRVGNNGSICVQWYNSRNGNARSAFRPGFVQHTTNERYYNDKKLHRRHSVYDSDLSGTDLVISDHVIGKPFELTKALRLPSWVLRSIAEDPLINFSLPPELANCVWG